MSQDTDTFRYLVDEFADIRVMRYKVPGWEDLTLRQKEYIYHLTEAARWGRDILWDQNCRYNLRLRRLLEKIIREYAGDRACQDFTAFLTYAKRVFFANGIHHHYSEDKILPEFSRGYLASLMDAVGSDEDRDFILRLVCDPEFLPQRKCTDTEGDIVIKSAVNFYDGVTRAEAESYYAALASEDGDRPVSHGLNSRLEKDAEGRICERIWKEGGLYGPAISRICAELVKAREVAENDAQRHYIGLLLKYYRTGDLHVWDEYNIAWLQDTGSKVDFINGFIEDYNDPLARKGAWEGLVNVRDDIASRRTEILSANAQWFEDHSPVSPAFRKSAVRGVSAKVINVVTLSGDAYPATPIGINLPNADWIRRDYGSKSVTIANITHAYDKAAAESPRSTLVEFAWDEEEIRMARQYLQLTNDIHTDLHECLGHGSGQLLPGTPAGALGEFSSTLEEARADLFGLYFCADPKLVELGILPDAEAYKAQYSNYIRNGIMVQFNRVAPGRPNTEAHMQNRKLIAEWCYEQGQADRVIEKRVREGNTYFVVNDYEALRQLFGKLLSEVQRIKSEGDYAAGKALVEKYAVHIDSGLHAEVLRRYAALGLKPYGGFANPDIRPVMKDGVITDYALSYDEGYLEQMMRYGQEYAAL